MYFIKEFLINDYDLNFNNLLQQLTTSEFNKKLFLKSYKNISNNKKIYIIKDDYNKTIATGSIIIEQKFTHNFLKVGHIEDIVVCKNHRGKGLGKLLIDYLIKIAKIYKCYKIILNCSEKYEKFYEKLGFSSKNIEMSLYLS